MIAEERRAMLVPPGVPGKSSHAGGPKGQPKESNEPDEPIRMILDTDTYNEVDDQFALVYALLSERLRVEAVYAAPFSNGNSIGPGDGMEKSYEEIFRVLDRLGHPNKGLVYRGSDRYLGSLATPVVSPATDDLIARALMPRSRPLQVVAIGAITNIASALLLAPEIASKIVVVWLGGEPHAWPRPMINAFNLYQDVPASRLLLDSGVPLVHIPCINVAEHLRTTLPELAEFVKGRGRDTGPGRELIGDYLHRIVAGYREEELQHVPSAQRVGYAYSKVIWDVSTIGYLNNPSWAPSELVPSPVLNDDLTWGPIDPTRHEIREVWSIDRDAMFSDLFARIASIGGG